MSGFTALHDCNETDRRGPLLRKAPLLLDETIRDGLQSPSVRDPTIAIGHYSGRSNVVWWLSAHGYEVHDESVERLLRHAKQQDHTLSDEEIHAFLR
jgi:isopropylmalate/homocitrate/citramalate synthase